jgi:hypothetical protein
MLAMTRKNEARVILFIGNTERLTTRRGDGVLRLDSRIASKVVNLPSRRVPVHYRIQTVCPCVANSA